MSSPYINHFIQPDTLIPDPSNPQAWNRYSYALNNPILYKDSSGHFAIIATIIVVGIVVVGWLAFAPPAYAPTSATDLEARSNIAESSSYTKIARWIDDHPIKYVTLVTLAVYAPKAIAGALADTCGSSEPPQLANGNKFHYGEGGGNDQLQDMYDETQFSFKGRGEKGPDVEFTGGRHPSEYPGSTWDADNDYGDFKPNTKSSRDNFYREIRNEKLPQNTQPLPYDKGLFKLLKDHFFKPK